MDDETKNDQDGQQEAPRASSQESSHEGGQGGQEAELRKLRAQALDALLPLIDKIDEPAGRKFEILMTAARSTDDPGLLAKTLEAAQQINGDSQKADAILDVLNEINYHLQNS